MQKSIGIVAVLMAGFAATGYGFSRLAISGAAVANWRWTHQYLLIFLVLTLIVAVTGSWRGPRVAGIVVGATLAVVLGAAVPVAVLAGLALSAFTLGRLLLRDTGVAVTDSLLVGIVVAATVLGLLVHWPVNNAGTWGLLFALPLAVGWRHVRGLCPTFSLPASAGVHQYLLYCAISAAAMLHVLVGLMPEVGHDALVTHLFVPAHVAHHQAWHFDARTYVWALMPMFVDWLYTAGYLFAGETGARMINVGGILLLASLVQRLAQWAGANRIGASWAVLLLLVTPLTFLESSSLFVESIWSALVVGGTLALLRLHAKPANGRTDIMLAAVLLGGAVAAKALTFTVLPVLVLMMLVCARRWFTRELMPVAGFALLVFVFLGAIPYAKAYVLTGNPVFPFFNAYFQSPLYPSENFSPPAIFERGLAWDTLYRMTFDSGKYLESTAGAAGFQWLLLVVPGALVLAMTRHRRALLLALVGTGWLWLAFAQTAYLRYVFPTFALACSLVAVALTVTASSGRWVWRLAILAAVSTLVLNLLHFNAGTYYGKISPNVIVDARARDSYIEGMVPVRAVVDLVNALNRDLAPVAFFSAPLTAGLQADALYANWYNPRYQAAVNAVNDPGSMGRLLARENVEFVVLDEASKASDLYSRVSGATTEVARVGKVSVRRLDDRHRYTEELLPSLDVGSGWQLAAGAVATQEGGVLVTVVSPAYAAVPVRAGGRYRYTAEARCADGPAQGRLQVNWLRADGELARADIEVFECTPELTTYNMDVSAPAGVAQALVYASAHTASPVFFSRVSFRN
jgi:hypothetical protein